MTYTGSEYSSENLFHELLRQVRAEDVRSFDAYRDLVDSLIEERKSYGFFSEDEDLEQIKRSLESRWSEIESMISE